MCILMAEVPIVHNPISCPRVPATSLPNPPLTSETIRLQARLSTFTTQTSGLASGKIQANLIVLPSEHARSFRLLCGRNPVPCPLLAESIAPGRYDSFKSYIPGVSDQELFTGTIDIRHDIPRYNVYKHGRLLDAGCTDIEKQWNEDSVAFLIGCSFSFEGALAMVGLTPRHVQMGRNVPMYRSKIPLNASGVFVGSTYVVSMRSYKRSEIETVRAITRPFTITHGEPIDWGWDAALRLGILDIDVPDFGDAPLAADGRKYGQVASRGHGEDEEIPVFWGCGVTPQEGIMRAGNKIDGLVMGHCPGHMLVMDVDEERIRQW